MKIFLINLLRRRDRFDAMSDQLTNLGLTFRRIHALDAAIVSDAWINQYFAAQGPFGPLGKGDKCCSLSHVYAWIAFLATDAPYGLILEDDVELDSSAAHLLRDDNWVPRWIKLLKLEHFGPEGQRILVGEKIHIDAERSVAEIYSKHAGAGAYIVSRAAARLLVESFSRWSVAVDQLLFNPNVSPFFRQLRPYQLLPTLARQTSSLGGYSDNELWRHALSEGRYDYVKRKIVSSYYELRLVPWQFGLVLNRHGSLVRVSNQFARRT